MERRRCPDCGVKLETVEFNTAEGGGYVEVNNYQEELLQSLGVVDTMSLDGKERLDVHTKMCPNCGLLRLYADVDG